MLDAPPPAPFRPRRSSVRAVVAVNVLSLILATALLVASVLAGFWLIDSAPDAPRTPTASELSAVAAHEYYGGDAYTGIQNAAADTENAVVVGANELAELASELQETQLEADAAWWTHLWTALAALIVVIAAANFINVLQRCVGQRPLVPSAVVPVSAGPVAAADGGGHAGGHGPGAV